MNHRHRLRICFLILVFGVYSATANPSEDITSPKAPEYDEIRKHCEVSSDSERSLNITCTAMTKELLRELTILLTSPNIYVSSRRISLVFRNISFYSHVGLSSNIDFTELTFEDCYIERSALRTLILFGEYVALIFKSSTLTGFWPEINLHPLFEVNMTFIDSTIEKVFTPQSKYPGCATIIREFIFESNFPCGFVEFFGVKCSYENLFTLRISHPKSAFTVIDSDNFTMMSVLQILELPNCGIEVIDDHAFDGLLKTLRRLNLEGNEMKHIRPALLRNMLERATPAFEEIRLSENPLICDCENGLMIELSYQRTEYSSQSILTEPIPCNLDRDSSALDQCDGIQTIHPSQICVSFARQELAHPKYHLKVVERSSHFIIKSERNDRFRLWIQDNLNLVKYTSTWSNLQETCPSRQFMRASVKCFLFHNETVALPLLQQFPSSKSITVCVNYLLGKTMKFWPTNCVTQHLTAGGGSRMAFSAADLFICCCIAAVSIGLYAGIWYARWRGKASKNQIEEDESKFSALRGTHGLYGYRRPSNIYTSL